MPKVCKNTVAWVIARASVMTVLYRLAILYMLSECGRLARLSAFIYVVTSVQTTNYARCFVC